MLLSNNDDESGGIWPIGQLAAIRIKQIRALNTALIAPRNGPFSIIPLHNRLRTARGKKFSSCVCSDDRPWGIPARADFPASNPAGHSGGPCLFDQKT
jgi:hypothetical protein